MTGREAYRFLDRLRVRWAEVDLQRIVFNGHYLTYIDTAVTGYWRALALPYQPTFEELGGELFVRKATLEYHGSARLDELLDVGMRVQRLGRSSLVFDAGVWRGDVLLVQGELVYVYADPVARASRPLPPALRALLQAFEAGEAMLDVEVGAGLQDALSAVQQVAIADEPALAALLPGADAPAAAAEGEALYAVARNRLGREVGAGRLRLAQAEATADGLAVLPGLRGGGIGRALLQALADAARARGARRLRLQLPGAALPFGLRCGFAPDPDGSAPGPLRWLRREL